ncbi:putative myb/SANT-like domain-containing protein [Cinnamomum micranthum f. kanehirae]|uniref:Putative myb/SANT-like domain-containing protein n=1 Tax=Cinnamomum micranthum f. kanehirae TaxID=337451 RepID=A0A443PVR0_9MAGN|nr:putative myb/SANT-like domain-containing protein [Cinnamomum micranthum f. kanehirae]
MDMIEDMDTNEKGPGKNKRKWTDAEDKELVYALFDMVNAGTHKADNGFKPGFLGVIEAVLKQKLPGSGIKAKPHIDSRIKTMKKDFRVVYDMLNGENCSGFGWDPQKNVVVAEDEVWNGYVKTHKGAGQWSSRSFPHYEMLCTIFGKDRATGKGAATTEDVLNEVTRNEEYEDSQDLGMDFEIVERNVSTPSTNSERTSQTGKRKRSTDNMDGFREAAMIIGNKIDEATEKFSRAIGVDLDIANKRDKINEELRNHCGNLERAERHKALIAIARDHEMTTVLFTLENDEKEEFVRALLSGGL